MLSHDAGLSAYLNHCTQVPFHGTVYRVAWSGADPVRGSRTHGRWNSRNGRFDVLNTSLTMQGACAEFEAFWSLFEQRPDRLASIWTLTARLERVVDLGFAELRDLGVAEASYGERDYSRTHDISDALSDLGCDGLIAPSARYPGSNLLVYTQNLDDGCFVRSEGASDFVWS